MEPHSMIRYGPPVSQVLAPRRAISRSRTGCGTCRLRKKKCDEAAGTECNNCRKGNLKCSGYPARTDWNGGRQRRRSAKQRPPDQAGVNQTSSALPEANMKDPSQEDVDFGYFVHSSPPLADVESSDHGMMVNIDRNYVGTDYFYPQFGEDFAMPEDMSRFIEMEPQCSLPFELSHVIIGVDTPLHRKLFDHFRGTTSRVLTTSNGIANPFNSIVLPLAVRDETMMKLLLSLAGSQLLKRYPAESERSLEQETTRLHHEAQREQFKRARVLEERYPQHPYEYKDRDLEVIFTTHLLLCLYEICQGSSDGSGNINLSSAGRTITLASTPSQDIVGPLPPRCHLRAKIHPFLLQFYYYHVFLASVTVPSAPIVVPQYDQITDLIGQDTYLVGVQDGLIDFIARISALRSSVDGHGGELDGPTIETALKIFAELEAWHPKATSSRPEWLVASFYQMALYIWLFSILNPDHRDHEKVQFNVTRIVTGMCEIPVGDGVMACMLFPLFVAGSAALKQEDRNLVITHFATLKRWSALGNIDVALKVVQRMWEHQNAGMQSSWNWVKQLEGSKTSLLVT
ncbi:hypothetical protein ONS96_002974 [Cadophora gregata f. sp. sojae]|nr:hypothetical protein ONS96_002974 [Cadophora gregata f. sp. sojae]